MAFKLSSPQIKQANSREDLLNRANRYIFNQNSDLSFITVDCFQDSDLKKDQIDTAKTKIHTATLEFIKIAGAPVIKSIKGYLAPELYSYYIAQKTNWYDRNAKSVALSYSANIGAHIETERFNYTVPVGRKAFLELLGAVMTVTTIEAAKVSSITFYLTVKGSTEQILIENNLTTDSLGASNLLSGQSILLFEGEKIRVTDENQGGTQTTWFNEQLKLTEFDA